MNVHEVERETWTELIWFRIRNAVMNLRAPW